MKIINHIKDNIYQVELDNLEKIPMFRQNKIQIAHDYIAFSGYHYLQNSDKSVSDICTKVGIQIPISTCVKELIPYINSNEYSKESHLINSNGEPHYTWSNELLYYYSEKEKCQMVAIKLKGESIFNHVTLKFFNEYIKPNLNDK